MLKLLKPLIFIATMVAGLTLATAEESVSILGNWNVTADRPDGDTAESTMKIGKKDDKFTGVATLEDGQELEIESVKIDGKKVVIEMDFEYDGQDLTIRVKAEQSEKGKLSGKWGVIDANDTEIMSANWKAVRTSAPKEESKPVSTASIAGKWNAKSSSDNGDMESVVTFLQDGDKFKGSAKSDSGSLDFDSVKVDGKKVEIDLTFEINGSDVPITIRAEQTDEDHLKGKWIVFDESGQEAASGAWNAERALTLDLAGTWNVVATTDNGDLEFQSIFEKTDSGYKGVSKSEQGEAEYTSVKVADNDVELEIPFGEGKVKVAASYKEKNKLTGKWTFFDSSDSEAASDKWVATKEVKEAPKSSPIAGEWAIEITFGDNEPRDYTVKIAEEAGALHGTYISPRSGETKCDSVTFKDGTLEMKVTREVQGNEIQFIYKGKLADDKLSGTVVPKGYEDQFSGEFTGKRK